MVGYDGLHVDVVSTTLSLRFETETWYEEGQNAATEVGPMAARMATSGNFMLRLPVPNKMFMVHDE